MMSDFEKLLRAKTYIDKLANGINPIDDAPAADSDMINNIRISRCLFYVSDVLRQIIDNNGVVGKVKTRKKPFFIAADSVNNFSFSVTPITVSEITKRLNDLADLEVCCKLKYSAITTWLISLGALEINNLPDGRKVKRPTEQGNLLGISTENRMGRNGEYSVVVYSKEAQNFIVDNIEAIIAEYQ